MTIHFTSDTHFGHKNIIKLCNRPFEDAASMDEAMIAAWNSVVKADDIVWHLGDFSFHRSAWQPDAKLVDRLHGRKNIIVGNHDNEGFLRKCNFEQVIDGIHNLTVEDNNETYFFVLAHYPLREWVGFYRKAFHLYGHVHGGLKGYGRSMDVGVDTNNFLPYTLDQVLDKLNPLENKHPERL